MPKQNVFTHTGRDMAAGLVVFLIALPLCLGIALASGAPLFSGIIAGIVGGIVIGALSKSRLSVSGPAAGLTAVVLTGIEQVGGFENFLLAVVLAGIIQVGLGLLRAGAFGALVPNAVIRGMLAAIGLILVLKQVPHALGYDVESFGSEDFFVSETGENTFTLFLHALGQIEPAAVLISLVSFGVLLLWARPSMKKLLVLPAALVVVTMGTLLNFAIAAIWPDMGLDGRHLVSLPPLDGLLGFARELSLPNWSAITDPTVFTIAVTVALVASIETLLNVGAVDQLDPKRYSTPQSRELIAQGVGNTVSGLVGGLPVTSVIVRSSANLAAGAQTKMAAVYHGVFLLVAVAFASRWLNLIPLACLAVILLDVGYKLCKPAIFKQMYAYGWNQFVPFAITVTAAVFTDLLRGVVIGLVVGTFFVLRSNTNRAFSLLLGDREVIVKFNKDISFIHKVAFRQLMRDIPTDKPVVIDASNAEFVDFDIKQEIKNFVTASASTGRSVQLRGLSLVPPEQGTAAEINLSSRRFDPVVVEKR